MQTAIIAVSDLHINSRVAISPPRVHLDEGGEYRASKTQRALWEAWLDFWDVIDKLKVDKKILIINGDLGELDVRRRTYALITPNKATIMTMILDTILPAIDRVDAVYIVRGTVAHTGKSAWLEEAIANDLDIAIHPNDGKKAASWYHVRRTCEGVRFDIAHHASMGRLPWTEKNAANKIAAVGRYRYLEMGQVPPDIMLRSHNHVYADSGGNYETLAICLPCWSTITEFGYRIGMENKLPDIGGTIFICSDGSYTHETIKYRAPMPRNLWAIKF